MRFLTTMLASMFCIAVQAAEFNLIIPNPPGSSSDMVARTLASELKKQHQIDLTIDYRVGGEHVIAAQNFVGSKKPAIALGTTTMHVFNPVYKNPLPYQDSDFDHVVWIGQTPHVWLVNNDSKVKSLRDLFAVAGNQKTTVGVDALSTQINVLSVQQAHPQGHSLVMIRYKGSPQSVTDLMGGHVDAVVASVSPLIVEQIKAGKLRVLGTTNPTSHHVGTQLAPVASKELGVAQFNGGFLISVKPDHDMSEIKGKILDVVRSDAFQQSVRTINIIPDLLIGPQVNDFLNTYRKQIKSLQ